MSLHSKCRDVYGCCMVDFKMMKSLHKGEVNLDAYQVGARAIDPRSTWTRNLPSISSTRTTSESSTRPSRSTVDPDPMWQQLISTADTSHTTLCTDEAPSRRSTSVWIRLDHGSQHAFLHRRSATPVIGTTPTTTNSLMFGDLSGARCSRSSRTDSS